MVGPHTERGSASFQLRLVRGATADKTQTHLILSLIHTVPLNLISIQFLLDFKFIYVNYNEVVSGRCSVLETTGLLGRGQI